MQTNKQSKTHRMSLRTTEELHEATKIKAKELGISQGDLFCRGAQMMLKVENPWSLCGDLGTISDKADRMRL